MRQPDPDLHPPPKKPIVILGYFDIGDPPEFADLKPFLTAVRAASVPSETPTYIGTYGPNPRVAAEVAQLENGLYAPMFSIRPETSGKYYELRAFRAKESKSIDPKYAGPIPNDGKTPLASRDYFNWGRELGRRFRDVVWAYRNIDVPIAAWQFDEVVLEVEKGGKQEQFREYTTGILDGLFFGRAELGDKEERGIVWYAIPPLPRKPKLSTMHVKKTPWLERFWIALDRASFRVVGEEYPVFTGNAEAAASEWAELQRQLRRGPPLGGSIRRSIGDKYVLGMSPGYHKKATLGGNRAGLTRQQANAWRNRFVKRRTLLTPIAGYGQYNFREGNKAPPNRVTDAVKAASLGITWNPNGPRIQ